MKNAELAKSYFNDMGRDDGVVIIYRNQVCGWSHQLQAPERWAPDCVAVDINGNEWRAEGGNDYNGADRWVENMSDKNEFVVFIDLVARMRQAQKDYLAHRQFESLQLSKQLENLVDQFIEDQKTPGLFK